MPVMPKYKQSLIFLLFCLLLIVQACRTRLSAPDFAVSNDMPDTGDVDDSFVVKNARELFAYPRIPVFKVIMPAEQWKNLKINCRDERYVPAEAWFEGVRLGRVGIRFKGAVGSLESCFSKDGTFICRKLSMKMKFNEYDTEKRFCGLKRLNFHGYRWDYSYMKERLAYDLYRAMGIVAPRTAWAFLAVNNELLGLFGMVEQVDGRFTADRWPEHPNGNLYKEVWPGNADRKRILSQLKTNEERADVDAFLSFSKAITTAKTSALRTTLAEFVDLDYMARYMAVDDGIANFDGITAFYVSLNHEWEGAGNHNYYFYQGEAGTFTLIPWDMESTFYIGGGFTSIPRWTAMPGDSRKAYYVWGGTNTVIAPGSDRVFRSLASNLGGYRAACRKFLDGPFQKKTMYDRIDGHAAFIRDAVKRDPNGPGIEAFENAIHSLKQEIPRLRLRLESFLSGKSRDPVVIDIPGTLDFEKHDRLGLTLGPLLRSNPHTSISVDINTTSPLSGKQDLLYSFQFVDEEKSWSQWSVYSIPLASGRQDVTGLAGIRMLVRADDNRILRIEMDSPFNPDPEKGIRYGWDVDVNREAAQVEVRFDEAGLVSWAGKKGGGVRPVLAHITGIIFAPQCKGRKSNGQLGKGVTDKGWIRIDNLEFF
jgi:spore coat protein CotH